jgi:hypothetical protein
LTTIPQRPRLHLALGRRCGAVRRLYSTQVIEMAYVPICATAPSEMIALNAADEPMLINDKIMVLRRAQH